MTRPECIACGLKSVTFRRITGSEKIYSGLCCKVCSKLSVFKWESAVDEWRRIQGGT